MAISNNNIFGQWSGERLDAPRITKTILYQCGCEKTLSEWGEVTAELVCKEHAKGIKRITTFQEWPDRR